MQGKLKKAIKFFNRFIYRPLKGLFMRPIVFYQRHLSKHTCLYEPTCSEYTKRSINNKGILVGIFLGIWRILRCNPLSKGGFDPAPEKSKVKWVL